MRSRLAISLAASLALAGCAVGPNYVAPKIPPGAAIPFVSATPQAASEAPLPAQWWRLYQDPVLDRLVQQALTENTDLKVAAANLAYEQALEGEARAGLFPSTNLSAGTTYGRSSTGALISALTGAPNKPSVSSDVGFTAAYQVDLFGRIRRAVEQASANVEASRAAEDAVRVTVAAAAAGAYANVCGLGEQLDFARRSVGVAQETYDIDVRQRDAGGLSDFDVARQDVLLQQARVPNVCPRNLLSHQKNQHFTAGFRSRIVEQNFYISTFL